MSQLILDPVLSGYNLAKVNDNFKRIEEAFNTLLLHKDGSKALTSDLDVNSQKLLNVGGIEIGGVDLLESIASLQETYNAYISEMEAYKRAVEGILDEAISYGAVDKKSIGNAQAVFTTNQAYAKNSNLTLPLKYIVGKNTLSLSLGHTYLLYKGVDYEEVGVVGEESQTIKIIRASGIGVGVTIEQVVDGDNDLIEIFENAQSLYTLLTTNYSPTKVEEFINSVSDVKELGIEDKISELWNIYNNLSALQVSFANTVSDINTKYSTITDMYEDVSTKYSVLETLYPQLVALIADTDFDLDGLNAAVANILSSIQELQALTGTIESNAQTASTAATSASTSAETSSNNATIASNSATRAQIWAEGTDTEVEGILGEHSSKGWAEEAKRYATGNIIEALGYTPADDADLGALDAVAVKHTEQTLTTTQQAQARTNIDAVSSVELTAGLATKQGTLTFDTTPTANSSNPVTSDGIKTAIETAVANVEIAVDDTVTDSSSNPVKSSGIFSHVKACVPKSIGSGTKPVYSNANGVITESGSNVGSVTRPICMVSGTLTQCTHTLEKSVPSDAEFLPAQTGNAGKILGTDGTSASWVEYSSIPSGIITMWSGSEDAIPTGWVLCDGENNTPDLRNRFIVGAGSTYAVGATGGSASGVTGAASGNTGAAAGNTGATTLSLSNIPNHSHLMSYNSYGGSGNYRNISAEYKSAHNNNNMFTEGAGGGGSHTHTLGDHTHTLGDHTHTQELPPYYALCYIMKI